MSLTQKNLEEILCEEPISEFINVFDYAKDEKENGIFYCQNGYRGFAYIIEPNAFGSLPDHKTLVSFFDLELPVNSAIQILNLPSQNLLGIFEYYMNSRTAYNNIKEPEKLKIQNRRRFEWLKNARKNGLINDKFEIVALAIYGKITA